MADPVSYERQDAVGVIRLDDGKANALSFEVLERLHASLDAALDDEEVGAVAIIGRDGVFSAGFDLKVMRSDRMVELMGHGTDLAFKLLMAPKPVVFGVTGHALAMGAVLQCTADWRVGQEGDFKIGFNEIRIGMLLPEFACLLADARLSVRHRNRAVMLAEVYAPEGARDAGFLDEVAPAGRAADRALAKASEMADELDGTAFAQTRPILRGDLLTRLEASVGR